MEVETPFLCHAGAVEPHLDPMPVAPSASGWPEQLYLVTSPELSMKRLLAAGSGPIYQIARSFRAGECGRLHNPEFTILEWYSPGFDRVRAMDETEDLVRELLGAEGISSSPEIAREVSQRFERLSYREAFERALGVDPFRAELGELRALAASRAGKPEAELAGEDRQALLDLLLALEVEPRLGAGRPAFVYDYPPGHSVLARVRDGDPPVAERFELYVRGLELANGYEELSDPAEQERRFHEANAKREALGKPKLPVDRRFLEALRRGFPPCTGVALGVDRVAMLAAGAQRIEEVLAFPLDRA